MINQLLAAGTVGQPTPEVGMGATLLFHSDRHAATITEVRQVGKSTIITTREDASTCVSGSAHDGSARYEFSRNDRGRVRHFRATGADGRWEQVALNPDTNRWIKSGSTGLRIGAREQYYDPHF